MNDIKYENSSQEEFNIFFESIPDNVKILFKKLSDL